MSSSPELPGEPSDPKTKSAEHKPEASDGINIRTLIADFSVRSLYMFIFSRRKSAIRLIVYGAIGAFFTGGAAFYYNSHRIPLKIIISMLVVGGVFLAFAGRQIAVNYNKNTWANTWWWIIFAAYSVLAGGDLYFEFSFTPPLSWFSIHILTIVPDGSTFYVENDFRVGTNNCSKVKTMLFVQFTNEKDTPYTIDSYELDYKLKDGTWQNIPCFDLNYGKLFTIWSDHHGYQLEPLEIFNAVIDNRTIAPKESVRGWMFTKCADLAPLEPIQLRFRITDADGNIEFGDFSFTNQIPHLKFPRIKVKKVFNFYTDETGPPTRNPTKQMFQAGDEMIFLSFPTNAHCLFGEPSWITNVVFDASAFVGN
jgi:hypothetical protein